MGGGCYCFVCLSAYDGWKLRIFACWEERVGWKGDDDTGEKKNIIRASSLRT